MNSPLHDAVSDPDPEKVKQLLISLDEDQLKQALKLKFNNETAVELAFRLGKKLTGLELILSVLPEKYKESTRFSWRRIFDLTEPFINKLNDHRLNRRITTKNLAARLQFVKPYIARDKIDLFSLANRPKFLKVALLLGAKYPNLYPDSRHCLVHEIMKSNILSVHSNLLLRWLLDNKYMTVNPFSAKEIEFFITANPHLIKMFLEAFPDLFNVVDGTKDNILHYSVNRRPRTFLRAWKFLQSYMSPEELTEKLMQKNYSGAMPALVMIERTASNSIKLPSEFMDALKIIASRGDIPSSYFERESWLDPVKYKNTPFNHFLIESGARIIPSASLLPPGLTELHEFFAFIEPPKLPMGIESDPDVPPFVLDLPTELIYIIASHLEPQELINFFTSNKHMTQYLISASNEVFWKEFHNRHNYPCSEWKRSWKSKVIRDTKCRVNWQSKKHVKIILDNQKPYFMDENWLISCDTANDTLSYWNCHSQQEYKTVFGSKLIPRVLISSNDDLPAYIARDKEYVIVRGETSVIAHGLKDILNFTRVDHRVLLAYQAALYDAELDRVVNQLSGETPSIFGSIAHNPFNRTFVVPAKNCLAVYELNSYKLVQKVPILDAAPVQIVDEFTVCGRLMRGFARKYAFIDLRTGRSTHEVADLHSPEIITPQRIISQTKKCQLVTSWHLPSKKIEWTCPMPDFQPVAANSRYLVGTSVDNERPSTVILDHLC